MRPKLTKTDLFLITGLLFLAAFLRFQHFGAIEHNIDRAYPIWQALRTLDQGIFPVTAQGTSVLFDNPALMGYLLLPATALTRTPVGAYIFVILFNWLAVALVYSSVRRLKRTPTEALFAAFLFAINPWIIEYSRLTWVQGLLPFFACLLFWLLVPILTGSSRRPQRDLFFAGLTLTALTQTYLLGFAMLAPVGLLLIRFHKRILSLWKGWLPALLIFMAATGIYGAGLLSNAQAGTQLQNFTSTGWHLSDEAVQHAIRLVTGRDYAAARGTDAPIRDSALRQLLSDDMHLMIFGLMLIGLAAELFKNGQSLTLLIWFFLPVLMMTYVSRVVHPFYLLLTLPAGHILAASGLHALLARIPKKAVFVPRLAVIFGCICFAVLSDLNSVRYAEQTTAQPSAHGFSALPLREGIVMAQSLRDEPTPALTVFSEAEEWDLNTFAGRLFPVSHLTDITQTIALAPTNSIYLIAGIAPEQSLVHDPSTRFVFRDGWIVSKYVLQRWRYQFCEFAYAGEYGLDFAGYSWEAHPEPGKTASLLIVWHVKYLDQERFSWLFKPFAHVFDATGKRVGIGDGQLIPSSEWFVDTFYIQRIALDISDDAVPPFQTSVGQYDGVHNRNMVFKLPKQAPSPLIPLSKGDQADCNP
jgi:4-amino-4-deoxy-L-arabinose transferase-like glycosyltransferase